MEVVNLESFVKEMAFKGKDFDTIVKDLNSFNNRFTIEEIEVAKRKIDGFIVDFQLASIEKTKGLNHMIIGLFFFFSGTAITFYTFFSGNSQFILAWGAILFGMVEFYFGKQIYNTPLDQLVPKANRFQKKRAFQR